MILTVGPSPAWQRVMRFRGLGTGVNRATEVHEFASGKPVNVAIACADLVRSEGGSRLVTFVGGPAGELVRKACEARGVTGEWVHCKSPTRMCITLIDDDVPTDTGGRVTELVENAGRVTESEEFEFRAGYVRQGPPSSLIVLTGSLPPGMHERIYGQLVNASTAPVIVDASGAVLREALSTGPALVKPNRDELAATTGHDCSTDERCLDAMRELNATGAEWVLTTSGGGPVLLTSMERAYRFEPLAVQVVNPIGCGDCLTAGIAWGLSDGHGLVESVTLGMAAAAFNAEVLTMATLDPDRVVERAKEIRSEQIA